MIEEQIAESVNISPIVFIHSFEESYGNDAIDCVLSHASNLAITIIGEGLADSLEEQIDSVTAGIMTGFTMGFRLAFLLDRKEVK